LSKIRQILFIINPVSGTGKKNSLEQILIKLINTSVINYEIKYTERAGHAVEIAKAVVKNNSHQIVVVVGGDGSVNEVARGLIGSSIELGIIPAGSGNGFARHLGIPLKFEDAIKTILKGKSTKVDTGLLGTENFFGVAGVGFDAHISKKFDEANTRGFWTYFKLTLIEYFKYKERNYSVKLDNQDKTYKALILAFCNSSQWGNNAFISPNSKTDDGFLRMVVVRKIPLLSIPFFAFRLFNKSVHKSKYFEEIKVKSCFVNQNEKLIHIDGEPIEFDNEFTISVLPKSLAVIV
tara:strand:- start:19 stop:897 length:879 start_codon:yes stop_codon:yes gene_type:complete